MIVIKFLVIKENMKVLLKRAKVKRKKRISIFNLRILKAFTCPCSFSEKKNHTKRTKNLVTTDFKIKFDEFQRCDLLLSCY